MGTFDGAELLVHLQPDLRKLSKKRKEKEIIAEVGQGCLSVVTDNRCSINRMPPTKIPAPIHAVG
jgi:hypothetical protein